MQLIDEISHTVEIIGVDLVGNSSVLQPTKLDVRSASNEDRSAVSPDLIVAPLSSWGPRQAFDLITCVHGLHYIGDKLGLIRRVAGWLKPNGKFVANFDVRSVRLKGACPRSRIVHTRLKNQGFRYNGRLKLLSLDGQHRPDFQLRFLGADVEAGPNYTGQPAVDGYYERVTDDQSPHSSLEA